MRFTSFMNTLSKMEVVMKQSLNKEEIFFFYNLVFKYEHESHAGYQDDKVVEEIGSEVVFDYNHRNGECITKEMDNVLKFTLYHNNLCWAILYHIRNSFAHGNLQSVDNDTFFLIKDFSDKSVRKKCNMLGKIEKNKLYRLIDIIEQKRNKTKGKNR